MTGTRAGLFAGVAVVAGLAIGWPEALRGQGAAPAQGGRAGGAQGAAPAPAPAQGAPAQGAPAGGAARQGGGGGGRRGGGPPPQLGTLKPMTPDARGWGWQTKAMVSAETPRPFYNKAKELLFKDEQVRGYTITRYDPETYCEAAKHHDYIWFEMQHSTISWDDTARMIAACPRAGAAPIIRMPDALESSMQKAVDMGVLGVIIPTVDDAIEARDAARFSRYPPVGRRSSGGGQYNQIWNAPGMNYRETINDNFVVVVMIETLEGVANADEIASTYGVDVVIQGNNDLAAFSGWGQNDPRYMDALVTTHNATLRAGKYWGNAGTQYLTNHPLAAATRWVQNGPARDGWTPPNAGRGRGVAPVLEEPVIGLPGADQPAGAPGRGRGAGAPAPGPGRGGN